MLQTGLVSEKGVLYPLGQISTTGYVLICGDPRFNPAFTASIEDKLGLPPQDSWYKEMPGGARCLTGTDDKFNFMMRKLEVVIGLAKGNAVPISEFKIVIGNHIDGCKGYKGADVGLDRTGQLSFHSVQLVKAKSRIFEYFQAKGEGIPQVHTMLGAIVSADGKDQVEIMWNGEASRY